MSASLDRARIEAVVHAMGLADCELVLASGEPIDRARVRAALAELADTPDAALEARRERLLEKIR